MHPGIRKAGGRPFFNVSRNRARGWKNLRRGLALADDSQTLYQENFIFS
jgi:hypothetical protein